MEKDILEKVLIKAVEYYFIGLSAKEAVNKALKENVQEESHERICNV